MSKNLSVKHYQENQERLQKKKLVKDIKIFLKKKKKNRRQNSQEHCKNLLENEKQKTVEYTNNCYRIRKTALL